ncbi:hypothetical protein PRIPAC_73771 [Pristionchus pacificus]|uniref:Uncharacterized protein n=1 Tax=Pristionchus pacificus TaxID=54126 RepID=A0A2A6C1H5_PRIPA|nr:hypothetical protein PRIPAC_73771 [Pristionchus pacificus]|eukprot:PDM72025.1 hypothetical protein PRIPAC_38432 [Pristionchus pacificus]
MTAVDMIHFKLAHNGEIRRFILPHLPHLERRMFERLHVKVRSIVGSKDFKLMWKTGLPDGDIPLETVGDLSAALDYAIAMADCKPSTPPCVHLEVIVASSAAVGNKQQTEVKTAADLPECGSDDEDIGPYCTIQAPQPALDSSSERPLPPPRPSKSVCGVGIPVLLEKSGNAILSEKSSDDGQSVHERQSVISYRRTTHRHQKQKHRKTGAGLSSLQRNRCDSLQLSPSADIQQTIGALTEPIPLEVENIQLKKELKKVKKELDEYRMKTVEMKLTEVERRLKELEMKDEDYEKRDTKKMSELNFRMDDMVERIEVLEERY